MLWKLYFILLLALPTFAGDAPLCTIESLTDNCKIFEKFPRVIKTSKNTFILNPLPDSRIQDANFKPQAEKPKDEVEEDSERALDAKLELLEALKKNPKISERFKIALSTQLGEGIGIPLQMIGGKIAKRQADQNNGEYSFSTVLTLPLPPDDPKAKMQRIEPEEFLDQLNKLGPSIQPAILKIAQISLTKYSKTNYANMPTTDEKQERYNEIRALFDKSKKKIAEKLRQMGKESGQKFDFEALAKKIDLIQSFDKYIPFNDIKECRNGPNAFYGFHIHKVAFCEGILRMPDADILGMIGHEIGHALDPCYGCAGLHEVDQTPPVYNEKEQKFTHVLWSESGITGSPLGFLHTPEELTQFTEENRIKVLSKTFSRETYPLKKEVDCITSTNRLRKIEEKDIPVFVTQLVEDRKRTHDYETPKTEVDQITQTLSQNPDCISGFGFENTRNESVADMFGAVLQADYLKANPPKTDLDKLIPTAMFLENHCREKDPSEVIALAPAGSAAVTISQEMKVRSHMNKHVHDITGNRINRSYLGHPEVAAALGCKPSASAKCFDRLAPDPNLSAPASFPDPKGETILDKKGVQQ